MNGSYGPGDVVLDGWRLSRQIGAGSFGRVFEAVHEDPQFGKIYRSAVKIITITPNGGPQSPDDTENANVFARSVADQMLHEIDLMYTLKGHSNIVSFEGHAIVPHDDGRGWDLIIRMELLTPLEQYRQAHPMTYRDVIRLGMDMCKALELCQKYNIIHRDIKPENIFVSPQGSFKLGDFGIARTMERACAQMSVKGTYNYMAPEVYRGRDYGPAVDIYSLGMVLYRLLNENRIPFLEPWQATVQDMEKALARRMGGEPLPPPVRAKGRLSEIVLKACAYDPADRYSAPWHLRTDLSRILYPEQEGTMAYPEGDRISPEEADSTVQDEPTQHRGPERRKKQWWIPAVAAAAVLALAVGGFFLARGRFQNARQEQYDRFLQMASEAYLTDSKGALEDLEAAMELIPQAPEAYTQYAYALYLNGEFESCVEFAGSAPVQSDPLTLVAAAAAFELGDYAQAAQNYRQAAQQDESLLQVEHLRDYAVCLGRLGQLEEAAAVFVMLTDRGASADVTEYVLGQTYYAKEQYDLAAASFNKVLDTSADETLLRRCAISLAEAYRQMGDAQALLEATRTGLERMPGNTVLLEMQGSAWYQMAQEENNEAYYLLAAESFRAVIDGGVNRDYLYTNMVAALVAAGDHPGALETAGEMARAFPRDYTPLALEATVRILMENEKPEQERDYTQAYKVYLQAKELVRAGDDQTRMQQLEGLVQQLRDGGWIR